MIRYSKQRKGSRTCGPIAIINAIKWSCKSFSCKDNLKRIKKNCLKEGSVTWGNVVVTLWKEEKNRFFSQFYPTVDINLLKRVVKKKDNSFIIDCFFKENENNFSHAFFVESFSKGVFKVVNFYENETVSYISEKEFKNVVKLETMTGIALQKK